MDSQSRMKRIAEFAVDFLYPNRCPFCDGFIPYDRLCCDDCLKEIEHGDCCIKCGKFVCECNSREFTYDGCVTLIPYVTRGRSGILSLKYSFGFNAAKLLVPELAKKLESAGYLKVDIITAVPMTYTRKNETGYNQAEYIAKILSRETKIPADFKLIKKNRKSRLQHELSSDERMAAANKTYFPAPKKSLAGKTVIICDDIITTGSTLNACAGVLKKMGAERVYGAVLAGTVMNEKNKE